jgi:2'-5' RNA ligase
MRLTEAYKEIITENHKIEYGCVMVILPVDKKAWSELLNKIDPTHIYGEDGDYGREFNPHVTLKWGLHHDIPDELIENVIQKMLPPKISMSNITSFENDGFDVLKFDVDSEDLHTYNGHLSQLPNSDEFPEYHPHCTIAYLNKGVAKNYHGKLAKPFVITPNQIEYSKSNGEIKFYNLT